MTDILIVTSKKEDFSGFINELTGNPTVGFVRTVSPEEALDGLSAATPDLVVIDETINGTPGLAVARNILMKNAMVNQALVSSMPPEAFHDESEGLGLLLQLPPAPDASQARLVLDALKTIP